MMKFDTKFVTRTAILLALTVVLQGLGLGQWFTGPVVNAMLYLSAVIVGPVGGAIVGLSTPWVALTVGILKPPLAPAIPFIMLGNALLVIVFSLLDRVNRFLAIAVASVIKFLELFIAVRFILNLPPPITIALQWPQLVTALAGGVVAVIILLALKPTGIIEENSKTEAR